jgi:hypothetical protein
MVAYLLSNSTTEEARLFQKDLAVQAGKCGKTRVNASSERFLKAQLCLSNFDQSN